MRPRRHSTLTATQVHQWALGWLLQARLLKDHGPLCTAAVVWNVLLRAAARLTSVFAACRDLAQAPSQQAVFDALRDGLPRTRPVLAGRLNAALTDALPRRLRRRAWQLAIDWHLEPYYGQPQQSRNEVYYGKPRQGTTKFHAYATVCIVQHGQRYTLALTEVRRHESTVTVLRRLLARVRELGLKVKRLLLDRAFFNVAVVAYLQAERLPFVMPAVCRGRRPKKGKPVTSGLRWIKRQKAGWYAHTLKSGGRAAAVRVCVSYRTHKNRKDGKRVQQKLLFAAWRVRGSPTEVRARYRQRFGIESSYRQMRQARITTCTRDPRLRLVFVAVALMLRNLWVWLHATLLAEGQDDALALRLDHLPLRRMLDWVAQAVVALLHDGSTPYISLNGPT